MIRSFRIDQNGNLGILAALVMTAVVGAVGYALDYSGWVRQRMSMQAVADVAALAAANAYAIDKTLPSATAAANRFVQHNPIATGNQPSATTELVNGNTAVRVTLKAVGDAKFAGLVGVAAPTVEARATAALPASGVPCVLTLDPSAPKALEVNSNASISAAQCAVQSNSFAADALYLDSNASLSAQAVCSRGGYSELSNSTIAPAPQTGCAEIPDPFADIAAPAVGACTYNNKLVDSIAVILMPGVYCGGITVKNNAVVTFSPGVFIIKNGKFLVDSNSTVAGNGVGFYLTGSDAVIHFNSNTIVAFAAPSIGAMAGILFFEDRLSPLLRDHRFDSNNVGLIEGTIYLPRGRLLSYSNSKVGMNSNFSILVARQIHFDSNADWMINADYGASGVPIPGGGGNPVAAARLIE